MHNFEDIDCNDHADRYEVDSLDDSPFLGLIYGMLLAMLCWTVFGLVIYWAFK